MISLYTGTPGSGKSLDLARIIMLKLKMGINVIGTMYILLKKKVAQAEMTILLHINYIKMT